MNAEAPNDFREQAEARIVALLLGEASPFEEAAVQDLIKRDPGLSAYYEEMKKVLSLVQAASGGGGAKDPVNAHPELSPARREALRQIIGKPAMVAAPILPLPLWRRRWFMPTAIAASLAGLLGLSIWFNGFGRQGLLSLTMAEPQGAPSPAVPSRSEPDGTITTLFNFRSAAQERISSRTKPSAPRAIEEKARSGLAEGKSAQSSPITLGLRGFYDAKPEGKTAAAKPDGQTAGARPATASPSVVAGVALDSKGVSSDQLGSPFEAGTKLARVEQNLEGASERKLNESGEPAHRELVTVHNTTGSEWRLLERSEPGQDKLAPASGPASDAAGSAVYSAQAIGFSDTRGVTTLPQADSAALLKAPAGQTAAGEATDDNPVMAPEMKRRYGLSPPSAQPKAAVRFSGKSRASPPAGPTPTAATERLMRRYGLAPRPAQPEAEARFAFAGESSMLPSASPAPAVAPPPAAVERYVERLREAVNPNPMRLGDGSVVSEVSPNQIRLTERSAGDDGGIGGGGISDNASLSGFSKDGRAGAQPQGGRVVFDTSASAKNKPADASSAPAATPLAFGDAISLARVPKRDIEKPDLFLSPLASAEAPLQGGYGAFETAQLGKGKLSAKGRVADAIAELEQKPEVMAKKLESPTQLSQNFWAYAPPAVALTVTNDFFARDSFGVTDTEKDQPDKPDAGRVPILSDIPQLGALFRSSKPATDELAAGNFLFSYALTQKVPNLQSAAESQPAEASRAEDRAAMTPKSLPPAPPSEIDTRENAISTFSLNVSDVSFRLAAASVEQGAWPDPAGIRTEEFVNAFDYRDPLPAGGDRVGFAWEHARYPFAHNRDVVRLALRTAAAGREPGRPLNLVVVLDHSGSMERADRVAIVQEAMRVLSGQLQSADRFSVILFARTAQLWVDGLAGDQSGELAERMRTLNPQGGTNLEEALALAYATALRHFLTSGNNRVILMTDGAANLGEVQADILERQVTEHRRKGIALDCFGIGWEGLNDDLLEVLARHGDGRYGFLNSVEAVQSDFARQLTGALEVAAMDVKAQVEFNPQRVTAFRQVGYARHQLTQEQFRDNTVDAAELGAAEAGNALYVIQTNPQGQGPLGVVRVRFKVPATGAYLEQSWELPFQARVPALDQAAPSLRLAATAAACADWLANSPYAAEVTPDALESLLRGVPEAFAPDPRPQTLVHLIRQARALGAK